MKTANSGKAGCPQPAAAGAVRTSRPTHFQGNSPPPKSESALGVIILAAGASTRMGRPKLLLPWGDTSVLGHLFHQWTSLQAAQIAVVLAADNPAMQTELDRLGFPAANRIVNPQPERGMFSSILCAAQWPGWRAELTHWAIVLGDQPHVRTSTLQALRDFAAAHPDQICHPSRRGHERHPVLLPAGAFRQLRETAEPTLKHFLLSRQAAWALCELDDPGLDFDVDTPADYERALRLEGHAR